MPRIPTQPNQSPVKLFNPSLDDFTFTYGKEQHSLAAYGVESFPKYLAEKMAHRLADTIISKRGVRENHQLDKEKLLKEIFIT